MILKKYWYYALFTLLIVLFCYFRIKPLLLQTVPYTFDQGRDFLRVESIIRDGDIAVYGPPTGGLSGLSHGVWWYYELIIPYILSGGNPIGFSYFILIINMVAVILFSLFLKKEFNALSSLFFLAVVAGSPYFTLAFLFPINSVMALPFILLLYYSYYHAVRTKKPIFTFLVAASTGFIFEAEVPFGLFLFPAVIIALFLTKTAVLFVKSKRQSYFLFSGLMVPFIPRLLAELITRFRQTTAMFGYFINPTEPLDKNANILLERSVLFRDYYLSLFTDRNGYLAITALIFVAVCIAGARTFGKQSVRQIFARFSLALPVLLFFLSLLSRKQHFYANYFEGIQYILLMPAVLGIYYASVSSKRIVRLGAFFAVFSIMFFTALYAVRAEHTRLPSKLDGLQKHFATLDPIYEAESGRKEICIKVYTPPVIPHTYNYLFGYYERKGKPHVSDSFVNGTCWFVLEKDSCNFKPIEVAEREACESRQPDWKRGQLPEGAQKKKQITIDRDVILELWQIPKK